MSWCAGWASRGLFRAHYAELPRLAHTSAMAAFAPALTPMLATPPARMFAATNMLVCVLLLLHFCSELLFPLCSGRSGRLRSCRATGAGHRNGDCGGSVGHLGELWVMVWPPDSHGVGNIFMGQGKPFCSPSAGAHYCMFRLRLQEELVRGCRGQRHRVDDLCAASSAGGHDDWGILARELRPSAHSPSLIRLSWCLLAPHINS